MIWEYLIFFIIFYFVSVDCILTALLFIGPVAGGIFINIFHTTPFRLLNIPIDNDNEIIGTLVFFGILSYVIGLIRFKTSKNEENDNFSNIDCPLEIVAFGSRNNIFTAGNNSIRFKVRNNSGMAYLFKIDLLVGDKWRDSGYGEFEIAPKTIKEFSILGPAWRKAKDIRISYCR